MANPNLPNMSKKRSFEQTKRSSSFPTFASVQLAQQHYDDMFSNTTLFSARVVLVPHHKLPAGKSLCMTNLDLSECVANWTLLFSYLEAENNEHSQLHKTSEGETSGVVAPFGFISTSFLHLKASLLTDEVEVRKSWCYDQLPKWKPDPTYDFYSHVPQFDNIEFSLPDIQHAALLRSELLFDLWTHRSDGKTSNRIRKSTQHTDLLYLKTKTHVELDFITFMLLAVVFQQHAKRYALSRQQFRDLKAEWLNLEKQLYEHRLITCFSTVLDEFMEPSVECYARDHLELDNPNDSAIANYMQKFVPRCKTFAVCNFEVALSSSGFKRRAVLLHQGAALLPLVYALPLATDCARTHILAMCHSQQFECDEQQLGLRNEVFRHFRNCYALNHDFKQLTQAQLQKDEVSLQEVTQFAPKCVRTMLHRATQGGPNQRLKHDERLKFSLCAKALNINWPQLEAAVETNLPKQGYKPEEHKQIVRNLRFAFDKVAVNVPSCQSLIRANLCGHVESAKRTKKQPQEICVGELNARCGSKYPAMFNPEFYFGKMKTAKGTAMTLA